MDDFTTDPAPRGAIVARIRRLLLDPRAEWPRIEAEPMTVRSIMTGWAMPLAAIGPVAGLIGSLLFGYGAFGIVYRPSVAMALTTAVLGYVLSLVSVWLLSLVIDALASSFDGVRNPEAAMKVAAFSATAGWLAGIFQLVPALAVFAIVGLYSLYLLFLGLPLLMKVPEGKAVAYVVVTIVAAVALFFVVSSITSSIAMRLAAPTVVGLGVG